MDMQVTVAGRNTAGKLVDASGCAIPLRVRVRAAMRKIEAQFPHKTENCPVAGESKLMFAIVLEAATSLLDHKTHDLAKRYFTDGSPHAELCGVSAVWVREVLEQCDAFEMPDKPKPTPKQKKA